MNRFVRCVLASVTSAVALLAHQTAAAHEVTIDLVDVYEALGTEFGAGDYNATSDLDNSGVHDADQANIMEFIATIADEDTPDFLDVHDAFHDNSEIVETALLPVDTGTISATSKEHFITLLGMFMTVQGHGGAISGATETGMRGYVESVWNQFSLSPSFSSLEWVQAEAFGDDHGGEGEGEGEGEPAAPGTRPIPYFFEEHGGFSITIPAPVEETLPIQWYKDGVPMVEDHHVTGSTSRTIHVTNMHLSHTGAYHAEYETHAKDGQKHHVSYGPFSIVVVTPGSLPVAGAAGILALTGVIGLLGFAGLRRK